MLSFACFRFLIVHPFFQEGQLTPFAPMCGRPCRYELWARWTGDIDRLLHGRRAAGECGQCHVVSVRSS